MPQPSPLPRFSVPVVVFLALLFAAASTLAPAAAAAQDTGTSTGTIGGRIFDRSSGTPVSGALIQLPGFTVVLSDDDGRFVVQDVPEGEVEVTFEHLAGPFQSCHERFDLSATNTGSTVTHTGTFQLRGGIWTAALAVGPVKQAFEHHVQSHLQALSAEL